MLFFNRSSVNISSGNFLSLFNFPKQIDKIILFLVFLLIIVCLYDLFSPPISITIWRQAQTAMLTDNFVNAGFSLQGLYVGLKGHDKFMMAFEFPIYNSIVGLFFMLFNHNPFWGKLVSLFSAIITLIIFYYLVKSITSNSIAFYASLFLIILPIDVLIFTSFQPDALGVMFAILSIYILNKWRSTFQIELFIFFSISLLLCGLCKFPILVPYIPIIILMYIFPKKNFRFPRAIELISITILFIIPFVFWYLYRSQLTDPIMVGNESLSFLFGNLSRFLSISFYLRPAIMLIMLVFCGTGLFYFSSGLRMISAVDLTLLLGIPFYYIVVPTVADQYYYLYPIAPIVTYFMGKGFNDSISFFKFQHMVFVNYLLFTFFLLFSLFGIIYVLRMDKVILPASESLRQISNPDDLIFVINMHDRGVGVGGNNPSVVYFSNRKGWNIRNFNPNNFETIISQINSKRAEGAKWLFVSWYTADLEPWYSPFLPNNFKRKPFFDSKRIANELMRLYPVARESSNYAIMKLSIK